MIADWCTTQNIGLPELSTRCRETLAGILPEFAALRNPLDLTGQALSDPSIFERVLGEVVDEGDIFLILRVGGGLTAAKSLIKCSEAFRAKGKTVLAVWMTSRKYAEESRRLLIENRIPVYTTPLRAMKAASALVEYARFLQSRASDSF